MDHWNDVEPLVLDFMGVRIASVSFFDESIGLLARDWPLDEVTKRLKTINLDPADRALLNKLVMSRARERVATAGDEPPDPSS